MSWSRTGATVRRGLRDVLRSGVAVARGTGWMIARSIALGGVLGGIVIIVAGEGSPRIIRPDSIAAAGPEIPLYEFRTVAQGTSLKRVSSSAPRGGGGPQSIEIAEMIEAAGGGARSARGATTQVPPATKIAGGTSWANIPATSGFAAGASYTVCFVPGEDCEGVIVAEINQARSVILVQAYSFTSMPIAKALVNAKQRGVVVQAILDKSQRSERYSGATFLTNAGIPTLIDEQPSIAHSKVIIIDAESVITGSFNFTRSAQQYNAENLIVIRDANLAKLYTENWVSRQRLSTLY